MKAKYLLKGIIRNIPGYKYLRNVRPTTGGTCNARYCYSVWLRHLIYAYENGFTQIPKSIAEFGPGDSIGIGLSALISGAEEYFGLDAFEFSSPEVNVTIFDELIQLFKSKSPVPNEEEFPMLKPYLQNYNFPHHIFSDDHLNKMLDEKRLINIRQSIFPMKTSPLSEKKMITYLVPWENTSVIRPGSLDMIISQTVLQHVENLSFIYNKMNNWLRLGGLVSHQIDFRSLNYADTWYGHWEYSDIEWKIVRAKKHRFINREPHSTHINFLKKNSFTIICDSKVTADSALITNKLPKRFKDSPSEDFTISGAFIQAIKKQ
jgi:hypothetical protein